MLDFFSTVDNSFIGGFFGNSEEFHYSIDNRLQDSTYLLCNTKLPCFIGHLPEKLIDSLIVTVPFSHRQDVVSLMAQRIMSAILTRVLQFSHRLKILFPSQ